MSPRRDLYQEIPWKKKRNKTGKLSHKHGWNYIYAYD